MSTRDRLVAFCAKSAKERGFKRMPLGDGIDLLLTIMDHLPEDTRLEE
jgi:hypothetical protein